MIRSPIPYPGGKFKAMPQIMELLPQNITDWREPFFGGGSVTLYYLQVCNTRPKRVVVGDLNPEIANMWTVCRDNPKGAMDIALQMWHDNIKIYSKERFDRNDAYMVEEVKEEATAFFNKLKNADLSKMTPEERCARQFLVSRISFSGLGDAGSVSIDRFNGFEFEHVNKLAEAGSVLQGVEILNTSYENVMNLEPIDGNKDGVFIFLDPPYLTQEKSGLYGKNGEMHFGFPHKQFAADCMSSPYKWLITYDDSPQVRRMFRGANIMPFKLQYTMALTASEDALQGEEVFIANYDIDKLKNGDYDIINNI